MSVIMKVIVKTMSKEEHELDLGGPNATVEELRAMVVAKLSIPADKEASLVHLGKVLNDDGQTLSACGIGEGTLIVCVLKRAKGVRVS